MDCDKISSWGWLDDNVVEANIVGKCFGLRGLDVMTIWKHRVMIQEDVAAVSPAGGQPGSG